jgi:hypothetical protein
MIKESRNYKRKREIPSNEEKSYQILNIIIYSRVKKINKNNLISNFSSNNIVLSLRQW